MRHVYALSRVPNDKVEDTEEKIHIHLGMWTCIVEKEYVEMKILEH